MEIHLNETTGPASLKISLSCSSVTPYGMFPTKRGQMVHRRETKWIMSFLNTSDCGYNDRKLKSFLMIFWDRDVLSVNWQESQSKWTPRNMAASDNAEVERRKNSCAGIDVSATYDLMGFHNLKSSYQFHQT